MQLNNLNNFTGCLLRTSADSSSIFELDIILFKYSDKNW